MASTSSTPSNPTPKLADDVANHQIDFTCPPPDKVIILSTPQDGDSLEMLASKMEAISQVINANRSIAVATNFKGMAYHSLDPVSIAMQGLTPPEKYTYEAWKADQCTLPHMDWQTMIEPAPTGKDSQRRNKARLEALRIIYSYPEATQENLAYITKHFQDTLLPLVRAVARIQKAKRHLSGNQDALSKEEWAEMQCVRAINTAARRVSQKAWIDINAQHARIRAALVVLLVRKEAVRTRLQAQGMDMKEYDDMLDGLEKSLDKTMKE